MDDLTPLQGVGVGGLLAGVIAAVWRLIGSRTDPKLIDLVREQNDLMRQEQQGHQDISDSNKLVVAELAALREAITGEIAEMRRINSDLRVEKAGYEAKIKFLTDAQATMRQDFNDKHDADMQEIARLKTQVDKTEDSLTQAKEDRDAMDIRVCNLEDQNAQLREQNTKLDQRVAELEAQMKDVNELLVEERQKRETAEAEVADLKQQVAKRDAIIQEQDRLIQGMKDRLEAKNGEKGAESGEKADPPVANSAAGGVISHSDEENPAKPG